jgi:hypothetical protein
MKIMGYEVENDNERADDRGAKYLMSVLLTILPPGVARLLDRQNQLCDSSIGRDSPYRIIGPDRFLERAIQINRPRRAERYVNVPMSNPAVDVFT